ncbi:MAG: hypothetical protein JRF58_13595 [Deltaproteobacteria bacterium]|nr:hypothetical protein [Deltaproteobacteria bacterium]
MNKLKVFLVTLTIIVLASICFTGMTMAAQVSWVNESKGRVHINGGVDDGYIVGATVCFIVDFKSGEKLVCGTVQSAEASNAVVKVDKNSAKRMRKGTEAMLYVEKDDKEEIKETQDKETVEEDAPSKSMRIRDQKGY